MYSGETGLRDIQNTAVGCDFLTHMVANGLCTDTELDGLVKNNVPLLAANESLGGPLDDRAVESLVRLLNQTPPQHCHRKSSRKRSHLRGGKKQSSTRFIHGLLPTPMVMG